MKTYRAKSKESVGAFSFEELIEHGISQGVPVYEGMPWSFYVGDTHATHENKDRYLVGSENFDRGQILVVPEGGVPTAWSPEEFFADYEEAPEHRDLIPNPNMTFGRALEALKRGQRVTRVAWFEGMYLWLLPAAMVKAEWCREPHLKAVAEANGGEVEALGSIRQMTVEKKVLTGWLPAAEDLFAEDWVVLPD